MQLANANDRILDALDDAFVHFLEGYVHAEGSEEHHEPECYWARTKAQFPVFGGVFQTRFSEDSADRRIRETLEKVRERPEPASWIVGPRSTPSDLERRLEAAGLQPVVRLTMLAIDLEHLAPTPEISPEVEIREARTEKEVRDYARLYPLLFGQEDNSFIDEIERIEVESWRSGFDAPHRYVAYNRGRPVCAGCTWRKGSVARLDTLCTLPEERNQGIGAALMTLGLRREQADGATHAIIWAGPGAEKLYARLGFEILGTAPLYLIC